MRRYIGVALLLLTAPVQAASFDCKNAKSPVELRVCANEKLSRLDEAMSLAYRKALDDRENPAQIRRDQREWLKDLPRLCKTDDCLVKAYQDRIGALMSLPHAKTRTYSDNALGIEFTYPGNLEVSKVGTSLYIQKREASGDVTLLIDIEMDGHIPRAADGQAIKGDGWTGVSDSVPCGIQDENGTHMSGSCLEAEISDGTRHVGFTEMSEAYVMDLDAEAILKSIKLLPVR